MEILTFFLGALISGFVAWVALSVKARRKERVLESQLFNAHGETVFWIDTYHEAAYKLATLEREVTTGALVRREQYATQALNSDLIQ